MSGILAVASGKTGTIRLAVPAVSDEYKMYAHFNPVVVSSNAGPSTVTLWEDKTVTGTETALTPVNRNRLSTNESDIDCFRCVDATLGDGDAPVLMDTIILPGTSNAQRVGASVNQYDEWVLKPGLDIVLAFQNQTSPGVSINFGWTLFWYEEGSGY
jgi:hypothetical protein